MKHIKVLLFCLLLLLASWAWCAEIHDAAFKGDLVKVKELLAKDPALLNSKDSNEKSPLHWAVQGGHLKLAKYLIAKGADFKTPRLEGYALLHEAAGSQATEIVDLLLQKGIAVDLKTDFGATALHYAAMRGPAATVSLLIKRGADVNALSQNGWWPLDLAVAKGRSEVVAILLNAGANANMTAKESQRSPLHIAAAKGYGKVSALLVEKGAIINAKDKAGRTPLFYSERYQHRNVAALLLEKGAVVAAKEMVSGRPWLSEPLPTGQAVVWYLGHSGWAVKTQKHLLIFDYWKNAALPDEPGLANGTINPLELRDLDVTVFSSHAHSDHYMPEIFTWKKSIPKITYVMGFKAENAEGYILLANREKKEMNGLEIMPIEANDSGQGYFVKVDGVTIFHPGDHANRQRDFSGPFKKEIDFLADQGLKADILFAPVSGCGFGDIVAVKKGVFYTIDRLSARTVFPMHANSVEVRYHEFAKEAQNAGYTMPVCCAGFAGDHFLVTPEGVKWASAGVQECAKKDVSGSCRNQ
jgi:ankyrin repeat protein/L-ascorbate metabolism protein UlaG (beta-lactamase superfamily)